MQTYKLIIYCVLTVGSLLGFTYVTDLVGNYVDGIVNVCENGAELVDGVCKCDGLPFVGKYCQLSACANGGYTVYDKQLESVVSQYVGTPYACFCQNKWSGFLCDQCHAADVGCTGECLSGFYGKHCEHSCFEELTYTTRYQTTLVNGSLCKDTVVHGGTCNYCSGHGECNSEGSCDCVENYSNNNTVNGMHGCNVTCAGGCSGAGTCEGSNCVCNAGNSGTNCELSCVNGCSGHGQCVVASALVAECECDYFYRGDGCEKRCPGTMLCSGHGECNDSAQCVCGSEYAGTDCSCSKTKCLGDCTNDGCACAENFQGKLCDRCIPSWYGPKCDTFCDPADTCNGRGKCSSDTGVCQCNAGWAGKGCRNCDVNVYPLPEVGFLLNLSRYNVDDYCQVVLTPATCHQNGVVNSNFGSKLFGLIAFGSYPCTCSTGFDPSTNCDKCLTNLYGPACSTFCDAASCSNHGSCDSRGACKCDEGFTGTDCSNTCINNCNSVGTCVVDRLREGISNKCNCNDGYYGASCQYVAPQTDTICNGRGVAVQQRVVHTGITFDCQRDDDCGDFSGVPSRGAAMTQSLFVAFKQALFGFEGAGRGPLCLQQMAPTSMLGKEGAIGTSTLQPWDVNQLSNGPFFVASGGFYYYPLYRTAGASGAPGGTLLIDGVQFYGNVEKKSEVDCIHMNKEDAEVAGCTWTVGVCEKYMEEIDASEWCYDRLYHVDNCQKNFECASGCLDPMLYDKRCFDFVNAKKAASSWDAGQMDRPFNSGELIDTDVAFDIAELRKVDAPEYDPSSVCQAVLEWTIPTRVYPSPRYVCEYLGVQYQVDTTNSSGNCRPIRGSDFDDFMGFVVDGVDYDTFELALLAKRQDTIVEMGYKWEYAETLAVKQVCEMFPLDCPVPLFLSEQAVNATLDFDTPLFFRYAFVANGNQGSAILLDNANETVLALAHSTRLSLNGIAGRLLEVGVRYTVILRLGVPSVGNRTVVCEGVACPELDVVIHGELQQLTITPGTYITALQFYNDPVCQESNWKMQMPPGWTQSGTQLGTHPVSIHQLCKERRDANIVHAPDLDWRAFCEHRSDKFSEVRTNLTRPETLECMNIHANACGKKKMRDACDEWVTADKPDLEQCQRGGVLTPFVDRYQPCEGDGWDQWCSQYKDEALPGKCAVVSCDCDNDLYLGVAGSACQLSCPVHPDTGTACGYRQPPAYPFGECDEVPWTSTSGNIIDSRCNCLRSTEDNCEEKCDAVNTPDCNVGEYGTYHMESFDIWGYEDVTTSSLNLLPHAECLKLLDHHNATTMTVAANTTSLDLCSWDDNGLYFGGERKSFLASQLVTDKASCHALNTGRLCMVEILPKMLHMNAGTAIDTHVLHEAVNGMVSQLVIQVSSECPQQVTIANVVSETVMSIYKVTFDSGPDLQSLDITRGKIVSLGSGFATVWKEELNQNAMYVYGNAPTGQVEVTIGGSEVTPPQPTVEKLYMVRLDSAVIAPVGASFGNATVYLDVEVSDTTMFVTAESTVENSLVTELSFEIPATRHGDLHLYTMAEIPNGTIHVGDAVAERYSETKIIAASDGDFWIGDLGNLAIEDQQQLYTVGGDLGNLSIEVGDELHLDQTVLEVVSSVHVAGNCTNGEYQHVQRVGSIEVEEVVPNVEHLYYLQTDCPASTTRFEQGSVQGYLLTSTTAMVEGVMNTGNVSYDGVECHIDVIDKFQIVSLTLSAPAEFTTANTVQSSQSGQLVVHKVDGRFVYVLVPMGILFPVGEANVYKRVGQYTVDCQVSNENLYTVTTALALQDGGSIAQDGVVGVVYRDRIRATTLSNGKFVAGVIVNRTESQTVSVFDIAPVIVEPSATYGGGAVLDYTAGQIRVIDYNSGSLFRMWVSHRAVASVNSVYTYPVSTLANMGDVVHQQERVGTVATNKLMHLTIESRDDFDDSFMTIGSPLKFQTNVSIADEITDVGTTEICSKHSEIFVWGSTGKPYAFDTVVDPVGDCQAFLEHHPATEVTGTETGFCSYDATRLVHSETSVGNLATALVTTRDECAKLLDYHRAVRLTLVGTGSICSQDLTQVFWGDGSKGVVVGVPSGTVHFKKSKCERGGCKCLAPFSAYFNTFATSIAGAVTRLRSVKYFSSHKRINMMQGPEAYLTKHVKYKGSAITADNWEGLYSVWSVTRQDFACSNPKGYAQTGERCGTNVMCVDHGTVCLSHICQVGEENDEYTGVYSYKQCLQDNLLLVNLQDTSAYMGPLCNAECPGVDRFFVPCSGNGVCSPTGVCSCDIASTMVRYAHNQREVVTNEEGLPLASFSGEQSMTREERTGWRGDSCELKCPGYDIFTADMTNICAGHGQCQVDVSCQCELNWTGEQCQLDCPNTQNVQHASCSGFGACQPAVLKEGTEAEVKYAVETALNDWSEHCDQSDQPLVMSMGISELLFYEYVQHDGYGIVDSAGTEFDVQNLTPKYAAENKVVYPVRVRGGANTHLVYGDIHMRGGANCDESTMLTDSRRPTVQVERFRDYGGTAPCQQTSELIQTCNVLPKRELKCGTCACLSNPKGGFWGGLDCHTCKLGYGGGQCTKRCPGYDGADPKTKCGGSVCTWGSNNGLFQDPQCICGDDPNDKNGYQECELDVRGTNDYFEPGTDFVQVGGENTCECTVGKIGVKCDQRKPTCLFGGTPNGDKCTCLDNLQVDQGCCPNGYTFDKNKPLLPDYISKSMLYGKSDTLLNLDLIQARCISCVTSEPTLYNILWDMVVDDRTSNNPQTHDYFCNNNGQSSTGLHSGCIRTQSEPVLTLNKYTYGCKTDDGDGECLSDTETCKCQLGYTWQETGTLGSKCKKVICPFLGADAQFYDKEDETCKVCPWTQQSIESTSVQMYVPVRPGGFCRNYHTAGTKILNRDPAVCYSRCKVLFPESLTFTVKHDGTCICGLDTGVCTNLVINDGAFFLYVMVAETSLPNCHCTDGNYLKGNICYPCTTAGTSSKGVTYSESTTFSACSTCASGKSIPILYSGYPANNRQGLGTLEIKNENECANHCGGFLYKSDFFYIYEPNRGSGIGFCNCVAPNAVGMVGYEDGKDATSMTEACAIIGGSKINTAHECEQAAKYIKLINNQASFKITSTTTPYKALGCVMSGHTVLWAATIVTQTVPPSNNFCTDVYRCVCKLDFPPILNATDGLILDRTDNPYHKYFDTSHSKHAEGLVDFNKYVTYKIARWKINYNAINGDWHIIAAGSASEPEHRTKKLACDSVGGFPIATEDDCEKAYTQMKNNQWKQFDDLIVGYNPAYNNAFGALGCNVWRSLVYWSIKTDNSATNKCSQDHECLCQVPNAGATVTAPQVNFCV